MNEIANEDMKRRTLGMGQSGGKRYGQEKRRGGWMSGDWLNKLTPAQPGVGCGKKNVSIAPDDERMT
ncbi:hypothetical protein, partial [Herbidospora sp. RD11066]